MIRHFLNFPRVGHWLQWLQNFHIKRHSFPIQLSSLYIYLKQPFLTQSRLFETTFLNPINIFKIFVHLHNISYFANLLQIILSNYSLSLCHIEKEKMNCSNITANS